MSRFTVADLPLSGLKRLTRVPMGDKRGALTRLFCTEELPAVGWRKPISQINHTYTARRGTVRGLHYQLPPHAEMKLVSCLKGKIWDVAVDLREGSPTFLQWHAEHLSEENHHALLIPEGFGHGFQALSDDVELLYLHSAAYSAIAERGIHPTDSAIGINWPLPISELSNRDATHPHVDMHFKGLDT
jgi:dTDP-4-dehydrorhamnose 3,5-epimerase